MPEAVYSRNGIPIRLTDERWGHITAEHSELVALRSEILETVANPTWVFAGKQGELLAVHEIEAAKYLSSGLPRITERRFYYHRFSYAPTPYAATKATTMASLAIEEYLRLLPAVMQTGQRQLWMSYDAEADVLYVNFKKPSYATDSELTDDDVIIRYEGEEIVGLTILHASQR
jgi:uncharacterized protein YuzE